MTRRNSIHGTSERYSLDRRTALRRIGTAGVACTTAAGSLTGTAAAEVIPEGSCNEVYDQEKIFHGTKSPTGTEIELEQSIGLEIYYACCSEGEWQIPFQINLDSLTYDEDDKSTEIEAIRDTHIRVEFESDHVIATETSDDIGNWTYYDKETDENYEDYAATAISFAMSFISLPTWAAAASTVASEMFFGNELDANGTTSDGFYDRRWIYETTSDGETADLQPQTSEWCQFTCTNLGYGEVLDVNIEWHTAVYDGWDTWSLSGSHTKTFEAPWKSC